MVGLDMVGKGCVALDGERSDATLWSITIARLSKRGRLNGAKSAGTDTVDEPVLSRLAALLLPLAREAMTGE